MLNGSNKHKTTTCLSMAMMHTFQYNRYLCSAVNVCCGIVPTALILLYLLKSSIGLAWPCVKNTFSCMHIAIIMYSAWQIKMSRGKKIIVFNSSSNRKIKCLHTITTCFNGNIHCISWNNLNLINTKDAI